ncbi:MAG TPA: STAS domain-containing protein [Actinocrinis sp.]|nr:STAS domain-containing protein [Actinocrinis sp.]
MTAANFTLKTSSADRGPATVAVTGEVDTTNAARFAAAVEDIAVERPTVLDLSDLLYVDSAGFAALHRIVAGRAVAIALPAHSPLRRAAVLMDLPHHDNAEDAAAALGSAGGHTT